MTKSNVFFNHISADKINMIDKLAYLYWYEHFSKDNWLNDEHKSLYEKIKSEVMDYGYNHFENHGS